jgi:hypothetical protein
MAFPTWLTQGLVVTTASVVSGVTVYFMGLRKWRLECQKLKLEIKEKEQALQNQTFKLQAESAAHVLWICAVNAKRMQGSNNLIFNEAILRDFLGPSSDIVYAAIDVLLASGKAKPTDIPGHWTIG